MQRVWRGYCSREMFGDLDEARYAATRVQDAWRTRRDEIACGAREPPSLGWRAFAAVAMAARRGSAEVGGDDRAEEAHAPPNAGAEAPAPAGPMEDVPDESRVPLPEASAPAPPPM